MIGGGAAGLFAAAGAAVFGADVTLLEKNSICGKKLNICGKGRGNITNTAKKQDFIEAFGANGKFLYSTFSQFFREDLLWYLESIGIDTVEERGGRVFPKTQKAADVTNALVRWISELGVNIKYGVTAKSIAVENGNLIGVDVFGGIMKSDCVIVATGGLSYSKTGSTGDGYKFAADCGHNIILPKPSICPIITRESWVSLVAGLSLKNVTAAIKTSDGKVIAKEMGEMLFTHKGLSGPIILTLSKVIADSDNLDKLYISLDLKPAISYEEFDMKLAEDFHSKIIFKNYAEKRLPKSLAVIFPGLCDMNSDRQLHSITLDERRRILSAFKDLTLSIKGLAPIEEAIITKGGVDIKEINPATMESKLLSGLFFAGELIDIDAKTGGYNLQGAFSTGFVAGKSAAEK